MSMPFGLRRRFELDILAHYEGRGMHEAAADQEKLAREIEHSAGSSDRLTRSENKLGAEVARTRAKVAELRSELERTGDVSLVRRINRQSGLLTQLERLAVPGGGRGIISAPTGGIMGVGPQAIAGIGAAIAALVPVAANLLGGAVIGAAGAGGIIGGILLAKDDPRVHSAWAQLGQSVMGDLKTDARVFVEPLVGSAKIFRDEFAAIRPDIQGLFGDLAADVKPLARGLAELVRATLPGLREGLHDAQPMLAMFATELPRVGVAIGTFFADVGRTQGTTIIMRDFLLTLEDVIAALGKLAYAGGWVAEKIVQVRAGWDKLIHKGPELTSVYQRIDKGWATMTQSQFGLAAGVGDLSKTLDAMAKDTAPSIVRAYDEMVAAAQRYRSAQLGILDAGLDVRQDLLDLRTGLKFTGRSLDLNTQKGIDNATAFKKMAEHAEALREQQLAMGQSLPDVNKGFQAQINTIIKLGERLGFTKKQMQDLLGYLLDLPAHKTVRVDVKTYYSRFNTFGSPGSTGVPTGPGHFQHGGWVAGRYPGEPQLAIVHAGEYVASRERIAAAQRGYAAGVPAGTLTAGGNTYHITVNVPVGANLAEIGRSTVEAIKAYEARSGTRWRT